MRNLKLQIQLSVDGFIAGKNGEMDWMVWDWDEKLKEYVEEHQISYSLDSSNSSSKYDRNFIRNELFEKKEDDEED